MSPVISVENLSKSYRLGQIGTGTLTNDLKVRLAKLRGKQNPMLKIGQVDHGNRDGEELWALKDVSFTVEQGEVLGIIGKNGAGKSTLLKILSRVTAPTSGSIKVKGRIASLLEVGTGFHPELTGRENIYLNGAILGMSKAEVHRKFDEIVDFAEVEKFIDTPVKRYSSGMYVRLAFAVAAHLEPEILLVDEVLAVGDAEFQKKCLGKMGDVAKQGRTVLFVSHNMIAVENLCHHSLVIHKGKIGFQGNVNDAIGHYLSYREATNYQPNKSKSGIITSVICKNDRGEISNKFHISDPINFCIQVNYKAPLNYIVGIGINDSIGMRIATLLSSYQGMYFNSNSVNEVICKVKNLPLMPNAYGVKIALSTLVGNDVDVMEVPNMFEILPSDFWENGRMPNAKQGNLLLDHEWIMQ